MKKLFLCLFLSSFALANAAEFYADSTHRGLIKLSEDLSVFPENRIGNGLYRNSELIFSIPKSTIISAINYNESIIVGGRSERNGLFVRFHVPKEGEKANDKPYLVLPGETTNTVVYISSDSKIRFFQSRFRSSGGFSSSSEGYLAFYHVRRVNPENQATEFLLHIFDPNSDRVYDLPEIIPDNTSSLPLSWDSDGSLLYELTSGEKVKITKTDWLR